MAKKKSKLKKRLIQASFLLLILGLAAWVFIPSPIAVQVEEARIGSFSAILEAEGKTQARNRLIIWAPVAGVPQAMPLGVGSAVGVKQVVVRLVPDAAAFREAPTQQYLKDRLAAAVAAKNQTLAIREQTAAAVGQARENLREADQLVANSTQKALQRDQAQVAMKLIFKELETLDAALRSAQQDIDAAETALNEIQGEAPPEMEFRAPVSGTVLSIADSGKPVAIGTSLLEIGNPKDLEVIVETPASHASQVSAGQRVQLQLARSESMTGRVRRVEYLPAANDPTLSLARISIEFVALPSKLKTLSNNQKLTARITLATIDQVLKISSHSLLKDGQNVFVIEQGRARKRAVTISAQDVDTAVIERGLKEHDRLIMNPGPEIQEGVRVQAL